MAFELTSTLSTDSSGGGFRIQTDGVEVVVDANTGFVHRPGNEWTSIVFTTAGEELTMVKLEPAALEHLPDLDALGRTVYRRPATSACPNGVVGLVGRPEHLEAVAAQLASMAHH